MLDNEQDVHDVYGIYREGQMLPGVANLQYVRVAIMQTIHI
jgi:hypothetical protein